MRRANVRKAERAAAAILRQLLKTVPPLDLDEVLQQQGLGLVRHPLEDGVSGMLLRQDSTSMVVVNVRHHEHRQRFTVAHEVGHFVLHRDEPAVFVDNMLLHFRADAAPATAREIEANAFAAALLMPEEWVRAELAEAQFDAADEDALRSFARRFQVSAQAMMFRLVDLGLSPSLAKRRAT